MNCTLDEPFVDQNGLWVVCFRGDQDWVRVRLTSFQAWRFWAQVKLRQFFGLPLIPFTFPAGTVYETGPWL